MSHTRDDTPIHYSTLFLISPYSQKLSQTHFISLACNFAIASVSDRIIFATHDTFCLPFICAKFILLGVNTRKM